MIARLFVDMMAQVARRLPYFRGKQRVLEALTPRNGVRTVVIHGVEMPLDLGELIQRQAFLGYYEHEEIALVRSYLRPGATVLDVGANMGYYAALASEAVGPSGRVLAFEPYIPLASRLTRVFADHRTVTVVPLAIGNTPGELTLWVPPDSWGNIDPSVVPYVDGMQAVQVEVTTLDATCARLGVGDVALLKIDVEGFEPEVLQGATDLFGRGAIRAVFIEMNRPLLGARGWTPEQVDQAIADLERRLDEAGPNTPNN